MPGHWTEFHQMHLPVNVTHARHALAIHELRRKFQPLLWQDCLPLQSLKQVWFAGAHADVGGGYPSTHLSDTALQWMASEAAALGLELGWTTKIRRRPATPGKVHHELRGWFIGCNATVRRQLTDLRKVASAVRFDEVHDTAIHRLANDAARQYRFWRPGVNDALSIADRASLQLILVVNIMNGPIESKACYASERLEPLDAETLAWIDRFTLLDLESAEERVNALFDLEGTPSYGSQEQIIRALALTAVLKNCDLSTRFISFVLELGDQLRNSDKAPDEQSRLREHLLLRLRDSEKAVNELSLRFGKRHLPFWEKLALILHTSNSKVACHDAPHSI